LSALCAKRRDAKERAEKKAANITDGGADHVPNRRVCEDYAAHKSHRPECQDDGDHNKINAGQPRRFDPGCPPTKERADKRPSKNHSQYIVNLVEHSCPLGRLPSVKCQTHSARLHYFT
jgi:hypothetical protein